MQAYLKFLNIHETLPVTLEGLALLTRNQVRRVPFESITSILWRAESPEGPVRPVDTEALLRSWVERRGGGVCFEIVAGFGRLLGELGFQARPINAQISWPGSHQALVVELEQTRYLVDVGNGAPFSEPIPLDGSFEVPHAGLAYRFRPDEASADWLQDRWIDAAWVPFCRYDLGRADASVREAAYQRHHTPGMTWVVDSLVLTRCDDDEVWPLLRWLTALSARNLKHLAEREYAALGPTRAIA